MSSCFMVVLWKREDCEFIGMKKNSEFFGMGKIASYLRWEGLQVLWDVKDNDCEFFGMR